jgi:uncharacterized membrane protein (UPF0182 family)
MSADLKAHLRYPEDLFSIQAAVYGRYHITNASQFFAAGNNGGDAWSLSPTAGVGSPANALAVQTITNSQGQIIGTPPQRMAPLYQVLAEPGETTQSFTISDAYVPASATGTQVQNLSAFMMSDGDGQPGQLKVYYTPQGQSVLGPAQADSRIQQNQNVSKQITFLDQHGSNVVLGNILMVPIGNSVLYVRPLYTVSQGNPQPQLQDVIAVFGQTVGIESTLDGALTDVLGTTVGAGTSTGSKGSGTGSTGPLSSAVQSQIAADLAQAQNYYTAALAALTSGSATSLATYETDIEAMNQYVAAAQALVGTATSGSSATTTTTTVPKKAPAKTKQTTTTTKAGTTAATRSSVSAHSVTSTTVSPNEA